MTFTLYRLSENFRCASAICETANRLMAAQPGRLDKQTISATGETGHVEIKADGFETDDQEAHAVAEDILTSSIADHHLGRSFDDCAVLVRTNFLADYFRTVLKAHGLPVKEKAKPDLPADWSRAKAALALLANPDNDRLAYQAILLASGRQKADEVRRKALENYQTINDTALFMPSDYKAHDCGKALAKMGLSRESLDRIGKAASLLEPDAAVNALVLAVASQAQDEVEGDGVTVSTLHGAKGREWQAVWLPAWESETIPGSRKGTDEAEERRLAFVGITRAKSYLWISWAKKRQGQWGSPKDCTASRFIEEIL